VEAAVSLLRLGRTFYNSFAIYKEPQKAAGEPDFLEMVMSTSGGSHGMDCRLLAHNHDYRDLLSHCLHSSGQQDVEGLGKDRSQLTEIMRF
jgi:hypothetical protein